MYLTYIEYKNMGGTLDERSFTDLERQSEIIINEFTFNRLKDDSEFPREVKDCVYDLIKLVQIKSSTVSVSANADEGTAQITSQSNDGVSISYNVLSAGDVYATAQNEIYSLIKRYLFNVRNSKGHRLTYKGVYPDE